MKPFVLAQRDSEKRIKPVRKDQLKDIAGGKLPFECYDEDAHQWLPD